jgi:hypothetical protein
LAVGRMERQTYERFSSIKKPLKSFIKVSICFFNIILEGESERKGFSNNYGCCQEIA